MSFIKALKCFVCSGEQSISDVNFPEDLFDLITKYKIDQLFWLCSLCKIDRNQTLDSARLPLQIKSEQVNINLHENLHSTGEDEKDKSTDLQNDLYKLPKVSQSLDDKVENTLSIMNVQVNGSPTGSIKEDKYALKYAHQILNTIKINHDDEKRSTDIVQKMLSLLVFGLKQNEDFKSMFNRLTYTGSSYNDLRITSASEYDINLVLKVPKYVKLTPEFHNDLCSFGKLKWEVIDHDEPCSTVKFLKKYSNGNYLLPNSVLYWLQSQIDVVVLKQDFTRPDGVLSVKCCTNGPARTIVLETNLGYSISIDIVAVFEFEYSNLQGMPIYHKLTTSNDSNKSKWFMVPKECQGQIDVPSSDLANYWRLDYPNADKQILQGKECAKSVIKILKIFRDRKDWKDLASYYLSMVVILEIVKNPGEEFWKNGKLFQRLMDAFKSLKNYLGFKQLPHFLTNNNLLYKFNKDQCNNWHYHLARLIPSYESNPERLVEDLGI